MRTMMPIKPSVENSTQTVITYTHGAKVVFKLYT